MFQRILKQLSNGAWLRRFSFEDSTKSSAVAPSPLAVYNALFNTLDLEQPGYGRDVHSPVASAHWASAYALIASAELSRARLEPARDTKDNRRQFIVQCGEWLLDNIGCASTKAPLWTLPYPRMIWEDQEPVKEGTAFCIPSSHSIQAMYEISQEPDLDTVMKNSAKQAALNAATYYAENCFDKTQDGIVFWYSPLKQHSFHVTNATAMMAGQLQRVSRLDPTQSILTQQADRAIGHLLKLRFDTGGSWGWNYFGEKLPSDKKNRTNDLLHEAFVCNGLLDYKQFDGKLGDEFSYSDLYDALCRFYRNDTFHEFSDSEALPSRKKRLGRALALGHALYVASRLENHLERPGKYDLSHLLYRILNQKYIDGSALYFRPGGEDVTHRVRVVAHVLLGLAEYNYYTNGQLSRH